MKKYVILIVLLIMSFVGSLIVATPQTHEVLKNQASLEAFTYAYHAPAVGNTYLDDPTDDIKLISSGLILGLILPGVVRGTAAILHIWHTKSPLLHLLTDIPPPFSSLN